MGKSVFLILFTALSINCLAQTKADMPGMWKIVTDVGMKVTHPSYLQLNEDGSYIWGIDSTLPDPNKFISKGTWELTADSFIKLMSDLQGQRATYYEKQVDDNGKRVPEITLEYSTYLIKFK